MLVARTVVAAVPATPPVAMVGAVGLHFVEPGQTLLDVARLYDLGYVEVLAANRGLDPWGPPAGAAVALPSAHLLPQTPRRGIVVNLGDMRLYWYDQPGQEPASYPIGIGSEGWSLPVGTTRVVRKRESPTWVVPASIHAEEPELPPKVPPGPDNPLGAFALDLARDSYRIHGTNKPDGVGRRTSHGCVRLYPEDIAALFPEVPVGTLVTVVDQPVKLAWIDGELYLEVHPSPHQADELEARHAFGFELVPGLKDLIDQAAGDQAARIDWPAVAVIVSARRGIPQRITAGGG